MTPPGAPGDAGTIANLRWSRTRESEDFFADEDRLRRRFRVLAAAAAGLLAALAAGLWRLQEAAFAPPAVYGISHGLVFSGRPEGMGSIRGEDLARQFADTVEVLFERTEKGLAPELREFCAPEAIAAADQAYRSSSEKYPAGFVQTLALLEAKPVAAGPGRRRVFYRGLLSSRSVSAAQTSPVYLDCAFASGAPTAMNATGWRLARVEAMGRDDFYGPEREAAARKALDLPPENPVR
jgi:hypothetical protein